MAQVGNAHRRSYLFRDVGRVVPTCAVLRADRASVQVCATQTPRLPAVRHKKRGLASSQISLYKSNEGDDP